jgi:hypothetical protein
MRQRELTVETPHASAEAAAGAPTEPLRQIPAWGWVVGAIFFPPGIFIVLAVAKALRWWAAIVLAILSYGVEMLLVCGYSLKPAGPPTALSTYLTLGFLFYLACVGQLQYSIGRRHGVWSWQARRIWWIFGIVWIVAASAGVVATCLALFLEYKGVE